MNNTQDIDRDTAETTQRLANLHYRQAARHDLDRATRARHAVLGSQIMSGAIALRRSPSEGTWNALRLMIADRLFRLAMIVFP